MLCGATQFAERMIVLASFVKRCGLHGWVDASAHWVFFDRGLIDAAAPLERLTGEQLVESLGLVYPAYNKRVFFAPPWPEIHTLDQERRHSFAEAVAEYNRLTDAYLSLGYDIHVLPKVSVAERADWILASLRLP